MQAHPNSLKGMIKDAVQAATVWGVATVLLVVFLGYPGWLLGQFLGWIFIISFIAIRARVLFLDRYMEPANGVPMFGDTDTPRPFSQSASANKCTDSQCNDGRVRCPRCVGSGIFTGAMCEVCKGYKTLACANNH